MQNKDEAKALIEAIGVCCELTGTQISEAAARVLADDLARYPHQQVIGALSRCRRELRHRLTLADVIARLADGRPAPQEAWAIVAPSLHNENVTIVWTDEMAAAFGIAAQCEDTIAARMAFLESYTADCQQARDAGKPVKWTISLGHDKDGRDGPLLAAVAEGKLPHAHAEPYLIGDSARDDLLRLSGQKVPALSAPRKPPPEFKALADKLTRRHGDGPTA